MALLIIIFLAVIVILIIKNEDLKKKLEALNNLREYEVEQFKPPQVIEEIPIEEEVTRIKRKS